VPNGGAWKAGYMPESLEKRRVGNRGDLLLGTTWHKRGASRGEWYNSSRDETSMIMYKLKEGMEKSYSDLLAIHQRKYIHGRTEIL
jgi:hypothetical protein